MSSKIYFILLSVVTFLNTQIHAENMDMVILGDETSESTHAISFENSVTGSGDFGEPYRKLNSAETSESWMIFKMKINPNEQNYLTLKFSGSHKQSTREYLYMFYRRQTSSGTGRFIRLGTYGGEPSEIVNWTSEAPYLDRFVYVTYLIPQDLKVEILADSIEFKLVNATIPIYRAYTHTDPFFKPEPDEKQGAAPEFSGPLTSPTGKSAVEHIQTQLDLAIDRMLTWQYFGETWDTWVEKGWAPDIMTGAVNLHGVKNNTWTLGDYQTTWCGRQNSHVGVMSAIEVYAHAFHAPWSKHYEDSELIDRVVKALDFLRYAQGSDGGYVELENWDPVWIGAPNRTDGVGCLMGFGMMAPPAAFLAMQNEITDDYLDEMITDGEKDVTRRQAYIDLFSGIRSFFLEPEHRGHASNQDVADLTAAILSDECLKKLDATQAWPQETRQYYLDVCIGDENGIYGGPWMSVKGTSMEGGGLANGGWDAIYSEHNKEHFARLAHLTGQEKISDYLKVHTKALSRMRLLNYDENLRPIVQREGWIGWRKTEVPGRTAYCDLPMSAVLFDDQTSLRDIQLAAEHGAFYRVKLSDYWAHLTAETSYWIRQVDYLEQALAMPETATRLPFEDDHPDYAWADEQAGTVVIKQNDINVKATLQWRHPLENGERHVDAAQANDIARVHYTTPEYDLMATTLMQSSDGIYSLYTWQYGKYLVAMNASADTDYELWLPEERPATATDLVSGQIIDLSSNPTVNPQTTLIFEWPEDVQVVSVDKESSLPLSYDLKQNYPNPFNPITTIAYELPEPAKVTLVIYDVLGRDIRTLVDEQMPAGYHHIRWDATNRQGSNVSSGMYFYRIKIAGQTLETESVRKMILLK